MTKRVSEKPKVAAEKPPVEKVPEKVEKIPEKNPMDDSKNPEVKKKENQPPENFEIRKSPRIKKRPADDTGKRSSRKSQPKKRKECSTPISGLYIR